MKNIEYAGFWVRVGAAFIDTILMLVFIVPIMVLIYGQEYLSDTSSYYGIWDFIFNYLIPAIVVMLFWVYRAATPGKMFFDLKIVDAETGGKITVGQTIGRYLGYYVSIFPLMLGIIWVGLDKRKQGWHDKIARTVVIRQIDDVDDQAF